MSILSLVDNQDTNILNYENPRFQLNLEDPTMIKNPSELFRERKQVILSQIDLGKLENSVIKSIGNKNYSYSHKELTKIIINLGLNTNPLKSVLVEQLVKIKKDFDQGIF